ncbi:MAG: VWA domain-containing protein [Phycisphaera sp.]|nr:VWA domain-containing protein [Phycisphaera sp.]
MKTRTATTVLVALFTVAFTLAPIHAKDIAVAPAPEVKPVKPVVQLAILLDTSNSMDGLINQARAQLWKIVNEFATAKQNGQSPELYVALYEYGNDSLNSETGYIRQVAPLTTDLDRISEALFALTTNGGSEYCGQVIGVAVRDLEWSKNVKDYRAIFIAGNEEFTQGTVPYAQTCKAAIEHGIIVNTIHCGSLQDGLNGKWADGAALADGKYFAIDQNKEVVQIDAPQDKELAELNAELNKTYIGYGQQAEEAQARQTAQDANANSVAPSVAAARVTSKAGGLYNNAAWDLVDASKEEKFDLEKVKTEDLPENMQKMTPEERKAYVEEQAKNRGEIQKKIKQLADARDQYVAAEMKKQAEASGEKSLDEAVIGAVREQATEKGFEMDKE